MSVRILASSSDLAAYETWVRSHPQGSLWQSLAWKNYQEALGREVKIYVEKPETRTQNPNNSQSSIINYQFSTTALVVIDRTAFGLSTWEIPRGPLWNMECGTSNVECLLDAVKHDAKKYRCVSLFFSPPIAIPHSIFDIRYSYPSRRPIFPTATRVIDLTQAEERILGQMHQKGRYNIRVAERHGVQTAVYTGEEAQKALKTALPLFRETGTRDSFTPLPEAQYRAFLRDLEGSFLILAYPPTQKPETRNQNPAAALLGVLWPARRPVPHSQAAKGGSSESEGGNGMGLYYYGASSYEHRALMAPYGLQWAAMRYCKERGCHAYDLLGVAPPQTQDSRLKAQDSKLVAHPWSGLSDFKAKFGGTVIEYPLEQEVVLRPVARKLLQWKRNILG